MLGGFTVKRMRQRKNFVRSISLVVLVCFLVVGCAEVMQKPGQAALACGAGGAAAGAAVGAAAGRGDWKAILIGAGVGAILAATACFAIAEYNSRQVKDYQETSQAISYQPSQGDAVQITHYSITPAAAAPGSQVVFNATYHVMTPNPDQEIPITETRIVKTYDPTTNQYRELGRVANQVTVKPGTRQADGKLDVRSGVGEGQYRVIFQVAKNGQSDIKELAFIVTRNPQVLSASSSRIVEVFAEGAKAVPSTATASEPPARQLEPPSAPAAAPPPSSQAPLSSLGEQQPAPPTLSASIPPAESQKTEKVRYFLASKVSDSGGNLRERPGTLGTPIGTIKRGERYPIVGQTTLPGEQIPWYKIRLENGAEAWVASSLGVEVNE